MIGFKGAYDRLCDFQEFGFITVLELATESEVRQAMRAACEKRGIEVDDD